jgi:glyoxylase-like metal-dependent hydrolase (beta-lactamase superfamily II)
MNQLSRRSMMTGTVAAGVALAGATASRSPVLAAAPSADNQAPGFYHYKVGDMLVTVVTDGVTKSPLADGYVANRDKAAVNAALEANYLPTNTATHPYTPIAINTGGKLVVIDTGLGPGVYEKSKGAAGQFHSNLKAAGYSADAVDTVIISHFHPDHINGLLTGDGGKAFANAEIMVPAKEWAFWMDDGNMSRAPAPMKGLFGLVRKTFGAYDNKVTQYEPDKELAPGITSVATPGHTLGHSSHVLASGNDRVLAQADITAGMALLFVQHPEWQLMFDMDKPLAVETRRKVYDMAVAEKMPVQGFHFAFPSRVYVEKAGDGYRLVPMMWNPVL